jgi:predicted site-specific integrase-resolvase
MVIPDNNIASEIKNKTSNTNPNPKLFVNATEASRLLGVERRTLFRWSKAGRLPYVREGDKGHWHFHLETIRNLSIRNEKAPDAVCAAKPQEEKADKRIEVIYARVSTRKQLGYLDTQIKNLQATYPSAIVYRDCASGLNFKRKGLQSLLQQVLAGRIRVVHVAYRDRLCRFAYDLIESVFKYHGTEITVAAHYSLSPELADDVLSISTVSGARVHARRSGTATGRRGAPKKVEAVSAERRNEGETSELQKPDTTHQEPVG